MSNDIDTFQNEDQSSMTDDSSMNVISERSEIVGTLKSRRNIKVAGKIDGGVEAEGKVIVDSTGFVDGSIESEEAYIAGRVEGDIHTTKNLTLASTAIVNSDLQVSNLIIEEGATFNGVCHMEEEPETTEDSTDNQWNLNDDDTSDNELFEEEAETDGELETDD